MQLSFCMEEGPRATNGLNGCTEVTSTLDKPRRGTRARFLADLQAIPVQAPAQFAERRWGASKGLLHSGLSHPKELEGGGGLWTSQHIPVLLLHSSIPKGGWRRGPSPHHQLPGTPECCRQWRLEQLTTGMVGQGQGRFAHGAAAKTSKTPYGGWGRWERFREQWP